MRFKLDKLPIRVKKCPITEAIIEIRFEPNIPIHELHAIIYGKFSQDYPHREAFKNLVLPEMIRKSNNDLKYSPCHRFQNDDLILHFGSHVFTIINYETLSKGYIGWDSFFTKAQEIFNTLFEKNVIKVLQRGSIRYVDFFQDINIFEKINLKLDYPNSINSEECSKENILFRNEFTHDDFKHIISISNHAEYGTLKGSCIDLDIIRDSEINQSNLFEIMEKGHKLEQELFFGLLEDSFLRSLEPQYTKE
ncbi:MAG: TIGR04255 family protein [Proteobacteria bacterium]|nr:TIGR04255 family protein [Pseudomonadota bacterium]